MTSKQQPKSFNDFQKTREQCLSGLNKCSFIIQPEKLSELGFECMNFCSFTEGSYEYELYACKKANCKVVFTQTYIEKEGGMFIQDLYANEPGLIELSKQS